MEEKEHKDLIDFDLMGVISEDLLFILKEKYKLDNIEIRLTLSIISDINENSIRDTIEQAHFNVLKEKRGLN
jgi:hypothetical protein